MTELRLNPAFNDFVRNQMIHDARDILNHINGMLDKWGLPESKLTGEAVPFVVDAVQSHINDMHEYTQQISFIFEYGVTENQNTDVRRANAYTTMHHFIDIKLRDQFMQYAPPNVVRAESLQLTPPVKMLAIQLFDRTIARQQECMAGYSEDYQSAFRNYVADVAFPTACSFVHAVGQTFVRVEKPSNLTKHAKLLDDMVRDFYMGEIPKLIPVAPTTIADQILIELESRKAVIYQASLPKPANDING